MLVKIIKLRAFINANQNEIKCFLNAIMRIIRTLNNVSKNGESMNSACGRQKQEAQGFKVLSPLKHLRLDGEDSLVVKKAC